MRTSRVWVGVLAVALVAQGVLLVVQLGPIETNGPAPHGQRLLYLFTPCWLLAVWAVSRLRLVARQALVLVLGAGALLGVIALSHSPQTSDDDYRYMWDAKVQLSGIDPYRYPPSADELKHLRSPDLFESLGHCQHVFIGGCTSINRPEFRTIYPPVAQGAFDVLRIMSFGGNGGHFPLQLAALLGSLLIGWLLLRRVPVWRAALWTWSPLVIIEYANNAHIDWLAALLVLTALVAARRHWIVGALVGAAIAVKLYPALVLPALVRGRWIPVLGGAFAVVVLGYVPHVIAVGTDVIGYLPGYLKEERYSDGGRLMLLNEVFGHPADTVIGILIMAVAALWAIRAASPEHPEHAAVVVVGVAFCVATPSYGWYVGVLLVLVALSGAVQWVPIVLAPSFAYLDHDDRQTLIYTLAVVLTAVMSLIRHRHRFRDLDRRRPFISAHSGR